MVRHIKNFLLKSNHIERDAFVWNMIAAMSNSFQSVLLMLVITQTGDVKSASYVAIGFAVANLLMTIGKFGMRNFQVTDIGEKYSFYCYKYSRYFTVICMMIGVGGYCVVKWISGDYSLEKTFVVFLFCCYKAIEAFEDVYHGRLQQQGRLDIAAKIWAIRNVIFILEFSALYLLNRNLLVALILSIATTMVLFFILNTIPKELYGKKQREEKGSVTKLLSVCFPIAVATFLLMYISNAPKYIIDAEITDREQTYFNILFMVIYVVTLLSNFIYNPVINKLALLWEQAKKGELLKKITFILCMVIGIVIIGIGFAEIIGRRLLGWIYGVSLENYKLELRYMIIAGGMIAIMNLLYMLIIMLRKQKIFYFVFSIASIILACFGTGILDKFELLGLCEFYNVVLFIIDIVLFVYMLHFVDKGKEVGRND